MYFMFLQGFQSTWAWISTFVCSAQGLKHSTSIFQFGGLNMSLPLSFTGHVVVLDEQGFDVLSQQVVVFPCPVPQDAGGELILLVIRSAQHHLHHLLTRPSAQHSKKKRKKKRLRPTADKINNHLCEKTYFSLRNCSSRQDRASGCAVSRERRGLWVDRVCVEWKCVYGERRSPLNLRCCKMVMMLSRGILCARKSCHVLYCSNVSQSRDWTKTHGCTEQKWALQSNGWMSATFTQINY